MMPARQRANGTGLALLTRKQRITGGSADRCRLSLHRSFCPSPALALPQDEVAALAAKEMVASGFTPERSLIGPAGSSAAAGGSKSSSSGGSGAAAPGAPAAADPQASIDELRAEIAYARAALNEAKAAQKAISAQN